MRAEGEHGALFDRLVALLLFPVETDASARTVRRESHSGHLASLPLSLSWYLSRAMRTDVWSILSNAPISVELIITLA